MFKDELHLKTKSRSLYYFLGISCGILVKKLEFIIVL